MEKLVSRDETSSKVKTIESLGMHEINIQIGNFTSGLFTRSNSKHYLTVNTELWRSPLFLVVQFFINTCYMLGALLRLSYILGPSDSMGILHFVQTAIRSADTISPKSSPNEKPLNFGGERFKW